MTPAWATTAVAVASFLLGAVLPFLHKRLSHEGYSVREVPWGRFGAISVRTTSRGAVHGVFGVIKAANGSGEPILIEDLRLDSITSLFEGSPARTNQGVYLLDIDRNRPIVFPPRETDLHYWATLPLILEPNCERELALWLQVMFDDNDVQYEPVPYPKPVDFVWRISGKSRKLKVRPATDLISLSMVVGGEIREGAEVTPVQLLPPGVTPLTLPPGAGFGLHAGASVTNLDLGGADLSQVNLDGATLNDIKLKGAQMAGASLRDSTLNDVNLTEADLSGAHLAGAVINDGTLQRANMAGASLRRSTLNDVDLSEADLSRACLVGAVLNHVLLNEAQMMTANLESLVANIVVMVDVNASDANLARAQFQNADMRRIDLSRADLRWANFHGASLVNADLTCARLHGADVSGADLSGAALPDATHERVIFDAHTLWPENYDRF